MNKMMMVAAIVGVVGIGCTKKKKEEGTGGPTMGSGSSMAMAGSGSAGAMMAGSGSAAAPAKPMTAEELAKRFDQCWGYFNDAKWDDFKGCYAKDGISEMPGSGMPTDNGPDAIAAMAKNFKDAFPDMKGEAVLELVSGHNMVGVSFVSGTNTGTMKTPMGDMPASKNKVGLMMAQVIELGDDGKAKHEWEFTDMGVLMGQMKPDPKHPMRKAMDKAPMAKEVVIAKDDAGEKANIETAKKAAEAFSKHDAKAFGEFLADDVVWSESAEPKDSNKKETLANMQAFWKAFSDVKVVPGNAWAGGDYVAVLANMEGTNDGDFPMMGLKKTGKKVSLPHLAVFKIKDGKIHNAWLFEQSMGMAMQLGMMPPAGAGGEHAGSAAGSGAGSGSAKAPAKK